MNLPKKAFILAAGKGTRLRPYSNDKPKALIDINEIPILFHTIYQLDTAFELDSIIIVAGYKGDVLKQKLKELEATRSKITVVDIADDKIAKGLLSGFALISEQLEPEEPFVAVLGDEFYGENSFNSFAEFIRSKNDLFLCCGVMSYLYPDEYFKNYAVRLDKDTHLVSQVIEKPAAICSDYFGLGLLYSSKEFADRAREELAKEASRAAMDLINDYVDSPTRKVYGCELTGIYSNINSRTDIYNIQRKLYYKYEDNLTIDVIIPAWNEAESIAYVVNDFKLVCRNVIVMDNVSQDGTAQLARDAGAVVYSEPLRGYGEALKKGIDKSDADIIVLAEADGTFRSNDMQKLLQYLIDSDAVIGSRTNWQYVEYGANMPFMLRAGNVLFGVIITLLWWNRRSRFTDVGCTYRAFWRKSYSRIKGNLNGIGPEFAPEVVIEFLNDWQRVLEVPVPYHPRLLGSSKFSGGFVHSAKTAMKMLKLILRKRVRGWINVVIALMARN